MILSDYHEIINWLLMKNDIGAFPKFVDFRIKFSSFCELTLRSIYSCERQKVTKSTHHFHNREENREKYLKWFETNKGVERGFMRRYAEETLNFCPSSLARIILEEWLKSQSLNVNETTEMMRDTTKIKDPVLSEEVWLCCLYDDVYGPISDSIKLVCGEEKELHLKSLLKSRSISFLDEASLRSQGYDKTPDIKLEIPCVIMDNCVINWIESKALFGDPRSHQGYLKDQYRTYLNRFGPGLVIYWFGYVEGGDIDESEEGIYYSREFPDNIRNMTQVLQSNRC